MHMQDLPHSKFSAHMWKATLSLYLSGPDLPLCVQSIVHARYFGSVLVMANEFAHEFSHNALVNVNYESVPLLERYLGWSICSK